jgi:hypothetical protein
VGLLRRLRKIDPLLQCRLWLQLALYFVRP